eukprot:5852124-Pleurochrysis_carterae.AAC.1
MICRIYTEQPLQGRARFELVVRTDSTVLRTPEMACSTKSDSPLPGTYQSSPNGFPFAVSAPRTPNPNPNPNK